MGGGNFGMNMEGGFPGGMDDDDDMQQHLVALQGGKPNKGGFLQRFIK